MARHNELGAWGEQRAREYLLAKGYTLMEKNLHIGHKELDIVATREGRMIFVEVKTRSQSLDDALDAVDDKKIIKIVRAANAMLRDLSHPWEYQFDIIAVIGSPDTGCEIHHYPDAFFPPLQGAL